MALGDSITEALYDDTGNYISRYAAFFNADLGLTVNSTNLGVGGWTSGALLNALQNDQVYREDIAGADVVTVFIGMNDFLQPTFSYEAGTCGGADNQDCLRAAVPRFRTNLAALLDEIAQLNDNPKLVLRLGDVYYPGWWPQAEFPALLPFLQQLNATIQNEADQRELPVAQVFTAFNGKDGTLDALDRGLLHDGIHPSRLGFDEIAAALRETGYAPLVDPSVPGDADCDGAVTARDAATVLQLTAGIVDTLECEDAADANLDGSITAVDSTVILQFIAQLVRSLPPP